MKWGKTLLIVLLMLVLAVSFVSAAISREGDVAAYCAETRDYCEAEVKDFAIQTDQVIKETELRVVDRVESELRFFKLVFVLLMFSTMLLSRLVGDAISFKRQEKHAVKPEERRLIVVQGKWLFWIGAALIVVSAVAVWYYGVFV